MPHRAEGRRNSPRTTLRSGLLCKSFSSFHLKPDWPYMPGMSDLAVIEGRNPHEDAGLDRHVVFAVGVKTPRDFQSPVPGGPAGRASHVRAIACKFARDDDTGNNRADRDAGVRFHRIRNRLRFGHEPACVVLLAMIWIEIDITHR